MQILAGHGGAVLGLAYGRDGEFLASAGSDGTARAWDCTTGAELVKLQCGERFAYAVAVHPTQRWIAAGFGPDRGLAVVQPIVPVTKQMERPFPAAMFCCRWLKFGRHGQALIAGGGDNAARSWPRDTTRFPKRDYLVPAGSLYAGDLSPDGARLAALAHHPAELHIFEYVEISLDVRPVGPARSVSGLPGGRGHAVAWSPDGRTVACAVDDRFVFVDGRSGVVRRTVRAHDGTIFTLAFAPDGTLFSGGADGDVRAWDCESGQPIGGQSWRIGEIRALAVAPDGLTIAAGGGSGEILIWDRGGW